MGAKGTTLVIALSAAEATLALLLVYIAWKYTDIQDHMLGAVLGGLLGVAVLVAQILFFLFPDDRRPAAFMLVFFGMILLPGAAWLVTQAATGLRIPPRRPGLGLGGLSLSYSAQWGAMTFYEYQRETVYSVQIENGRPMARLSYTYQFDIREMRAPLRQLVTANSWTFKAVAMPIFINWLTG